MLPLIVLPIAAFVLVAALARRLLHRGGLPNDWPVALVVSGLLLFGFVAVATELLSVVGLLRPWAVAGVWVGFVGALAVAWIGLRRGGPPPECSPEVVEWVRPGRWWCDPTAYMWGVVGLLVLLTLVVAIASPPNTHDALAYHLPRQLRWMDFGQVRHYACSDMRELSFPPLAEYSQMHTMLLTGGDVFVHLPQWFAYVLSALAAALACRAMGRPEAGGFAALLVVCNPLAYLQASSAKNDPQLVFFTVAFAWLVVQVLRDRRCGVFACILMGLSLGCAALTKTTAVIVMFPLCVVAAGGLLYQHRIRALWRGVLIAVMATLLVAGHVSRNVNSFGHPLGPLENSEGGYSLSMERHDFAAVGSNAIRNLALHAMFATDEQAARVEQFVRDLHSTVGWDPDDPQTTWLRPYSSQAALAKEGNAPAPLHVVYLFCAIPFLGWLVVKRTGWGLGLVLWGCVAIGFVLFVSLVKWNLWHSRLHAPLLAVGAIPVAVAFLSSHRAWLRIATVAIMAPPVVGLLVWVAIANEDRPLFGTSGVLTHPRNDYVRWRTTHAMEQGLGVVEALRTLDPGPYALLGGNQEYNMMRSIRSLSGEWRMTGHKPLLGRTESIDSRWIRPETLITAYHVRPAMFVDQQLFEMISPVSSMNVYRAIDVLPHRGPTEPVVKTGRYAALDDPRAVGRMRAADPRMGTTHGLVLPGGGTDVDIPGDETPRVLLLGVHAMGISESTVLISINSQVLYTGPIERWGYSMLSVNVPPMTQAAKLQIRLPRAEERGLADGAAVGWIQMPTARRLLDYDTR